MSFAMKTSPQDTTWADMLAVWQAADDIELIAAQVTAAEEAGIPIGIVYLPIPHTPSVLEPLASVLDPLAG